MSDGYLTEPAMDDATVHRIFSKIEVDSGTGCWNYMGRPDRKGYCGVMIRGITYRVHRLFYVIANGPIPNGVSRHIPVIDHLCRNPRCCNPDHLRLCSHRENILAGEGLAAQEASFTHCKYGHVLPAYVEGRGRRCPECRRMHKRLYYRRHREEFLAKSAIRQANRSQAARDANNARRRERRASLRDLRENGGTA